MSRIRAAILVALLISAVTSVPIAAHADDPTPSPIATSTITPTPSSSSTPTAAPTSGSSGVTDVAWQRVDSSGVRLAWDPPQPSPGTPGYIVSVSFAGPASPDRMLSTSATTVELANIRPGQQLTATITTNGVATAAPPWVQPAVVPGPPRTASAAKSTGGTTPALVVHWTAPGSDGGAALLSYVVEVHPVSSPTTIAAQQAAGTTVRSTVVDGLEAKTAYFAVVRARNSAGSGAAAQTGVAFTAAAVSTSCGAACAPTAGAVPGAAAPPAAMSSRHPVAAQPTAASAASTLPAALALPLPVAIAVGVMSLLFGASVVGLVALRRRPEYRTERQPPRS